MAIWSKKDIPHKGWKLVDVIDVEENYEHCMMCNTRIRFIHIVTHTTIDNEFRIGCDCAIKMTDDLSSKIKEDNLKRALLLKKRKLSAYLNKWEKTKNGNHKKLYEGFELLIFVTKNGKFKGRIEGDINNNNTISVKWGKKEFETVEECKLAILESVKILLKIPFTSN